MTIISHTTLQSGKKEKKNDIDYRTVQYCTVLRNEKEGSHVLAPGGGLLPVVRLGGFRSVFVPQPALQLQHTVLYST